LCTSLSFRALHSSDYFKMKVQYFITELSEGKGRLILILSKFVHKRYVGRLYCEIIYR
jgi:hypothetical protein